MKDFETIGVKSPALNNLLQHFKTIPLQFFLFLWVTFAHLDPDPDA